MAIVNRDKDASEQRYVFTFNSQVTVGVSGLIQLGMVPCGAQILQIAMAALGISGSPTVGLQIQRFVVGSGLTTFALNGSSLLTMQAFSTSGLQLQILPASGNSLALLQKGDLMQLVTSGANTAAQYVAECVLQILQDVKTDYGV